LLWILRVFCVSLWILGLFSISLKNVIWIVMVISLNL
jgi:hypothetical protein